MAKLYALPEQKTFDYVLKCQRDEIKEDQVIWHLKRLTSSEEENLENELASSVEGNINMMLGTQNRLALEFGLESVSNFYEREGSEELKVERKSQKLKGLYFPLKETFLSKISKEHRQELSRAIQEGNAFEEEDVKNS